MKLTLYTDYGLRVLMYLTLREKATVSEIAEAYQIARPHVVKVVHHLGRLGLVRTKRGRSGGVWLARPPSAINIGEVVRELEPDFHVVGCFADGEAACLLSPVCRLRGLLGHALGSFFEVLDGQTLADLTGNRAELEARLDG